MKKSLLRILAAGFALALTAGGRAAESSSSQGVPQVQPLLKNRIDSVRRLPLNGLSLVEAGGKTYFISDNGRFVIMGTLVDLWSGQPIASANDVERYANRLDLKRLLKKDASGESLLADVAPLVLGSGPREVVVLIDPYCPHCHTLIQQLPALAAQYTFRLVLLPILGEESVKAATQLWCTAATRGAAMAVNALAERAIARLPVPSTECAIRAQEALQQTLVIARLMGAEAVPFVVSHEGVVRRGGTPEFGAWLAAEGSGTRPVKGTARATAGAE